MHDGGGGFGGGDHGGGFSHGGGHAGGFSGHHGHTPSHHSGHHHGRGGAPDASGDAAVDGAAFDQDGVPSGRAGMCSTAGPGTRAALAVVAALFLAGVVLLLALG
jgi:hypothetical protein